MGITSLLAGNALAQGTAPMPGAGTPMASTLVSIQSFTLSGADCPAQDATQVTLQDGGANGRALLKIDFPGASSSATPVGAPPSTPAVPAPGAAPTGSMDPLAGPNPAMPPTPATPSTDPTSPTGTMSPTGTTVPANPAVSFQATGRNDQSMCTVTISLAAGSSAPQQGVDFQVVGEMANVTFSRPNNQGQLAIQSQIRLNNAMSRPAIAQVGAVGAAVAAGAGPRMQNVTFNGVNVRVAARQIMLVESLQLQTRNGADASSLTIDDVTLDLRVRAGGANGTNGTNGTNGN